MGQDGTCSGTVERRGPSRVTSPAERSQQCEHLPREQRRNRRSGVVIRNGRGLALGTARFSDRAKPDARFGSGETDRSTPCRERASHAVNSAKAYRRSSVIPRQCAGRTDPAGAASLKMPDRATRRTVDVAGRLASKSVQGAYGHLLEAPKLPPACRPATGFWWAASLSRRYEGSTR
jgi:hypothetical protein